MAMVLQSVDNKSITLYEQSPTMTYKLIIQIDTPS